MERMEAIRVIAGWFRVPTQLLGPHWDGEAEIRDDLLTQLELEAAAKGEPLVMY